MYNVFFNMLLCYYFLVARALLPKNPDSHVLLFKAIQHVIQNGIVVSLSSGVHMICPPSKRLLSCLLETIHLQHIEVCGLHVPWIFCVANYSCVYSCMYNYASIIYHITITIELDVQKLTGVL